MSEYEVDWVITSCSTDGHPILADGLCRCGQVVDPSKDEIGWFDEDEREEQASDTGDPKAS